MDADLRSLAAKVCVSDGAMGTSLSALGLLGTSPPEIWNISSPASVEKVTRAFAEAGSDIVLTNTLGANRVMLEECGAEARAAELAEAGAHIARLAVAGTGAKVFGSIGPTGKVVMMEEVSRQELSAAFAEAAEALQWGGADAIVLETFSELAELEIALRTVKATVDLPVIASMTFSAGPDKTMTHMGNTPAELARLAERLGAGAVGANCGAGPESYVKVVAALRERTDLPIWVKPNAGLPRLVHGKTTFPMSPVEFAGFVSPLASAGARFIGGCCGTTAEHIRAVRAAVDALP